MDDAAYTDAKTGVLKNKLGITDRDALKKAEYVISAAEQLKIQSSPVEGKLDYAHLKAVNKALLGKVYAWAGNERTVNIEKGDTVFAPVKYLEKEANKLFDGLKRDNFYKGLSVDAFSEKAANLSGEINALHPFREGNGRTNIAFMQIVAERAGHPMNLGMVDRDELKAATIESFAGSSKPLADVFKKAIVATREVENEGIRPEAIKEGVAKARAEYEAYKAQRQESSKSVARDVSIER